MSHRCYLRNVCKDRNGQNDCARVSKLEIRDGVLCVGLKCLAATSIRKVSLIKICARRVANIDEGLRGFLQFHVSAGVTS